MWGVVGTKLAISKSGGGHVPSVNDTYGFLAAAEVML